MRNLYTSASDTFTVGGDNPDFNPRLALAIATAKRGGFPKASIEIAIARGQGRSTSGAQLETLTIEAVVPPVALMIDCQTDSKGRALQDLRLMLKNHGATQTPTAYLFEKRGRITFQSKEGVGVDEVFDTVLEAGALDVNVDEDGRIVVDTEMEAIKTAEKKIVEALGLQLDSSATIWFPNADTKVEELEPDSLESLLKLQEELEDYPGIQGVYTNTDLSTVREDAAASTAQ